MRTPRVLVIDDSEVLVELLVKALTGAGYVAAGATDLQALELALGEGPVDLALVDVNMPEMYGDDVVEFLKERRGVTAPLLLHSELPGPELKARAESSGADGYVSKADGLDATLAEVRRRLGPPAAPKKHRILVVDDSEMTLRIIEAELTAKGFEVTTAQSAEQATKIILKPRTRPDLVLLDVNMPNISGEQLCRFIKGNSLFASIKVLLCSGADEAELRRICREAGADGFLAKDAVLSKVVTGTLTGY